MDDDEYEADEEEEKQYKPKFKAGRKERVIFTEEEKAWILNTFRALIEGA